MNKENDSARNNKNPQEDPSKAMNSKGEVERSNDEKIDQDFPGYPHYPAREDIMDQRNDYIREEIDVENLPNSRNASGVSQRYLAGNDRDRGDEATPRSPGAEEDEELNFRPGTEADVTPDEVKALEDASYMPTRDEDNLRTAKLDNTDFDGDELNEGSFGDHLSGDELDIPESVDETNTTSMGQGDEENKYYSLGGDRHASQEEDPYSGPERGEA